MVPTACSIRCMAEEKSIFGTSCATVTGYSASTVSPLFSVTVPACVPAATGAASAPESCTVAVRPAPSPLATSSVCGTK